MKRTMFCLKTLFCLASFLFAIPSVADEVLIEHHLSDSDFEIYKQVDADHPDQVSVLERTTNPNQNNPLGHDIPGHDFFPGDSVTLRRTFDNTILVDNQRNDFSDPDAAFWCRWNFTNNVTAGFGGVSLLDLPAKIIYADGTEQIFAGNGALSFDNTGRIIRLNLIFVDKPPGTIERKPIRSFEISFSIPTQVTFQTVVYDLLPMLEVDSPVIGRGQLFIETYLVYSSVQEAVDAPPFISKTPLGALYDLIDLIDLCNLANGIANSLDSKINNAIDSFNAENAEQRADAVNKLAATVNAIEAQRGNQIDEQCADLMIDAVNAVIDAMILIQ